MAPPKSVIHINFMPGVIAFDARPIWTALQAAEASGKLGKSAASSISSLYGNTALHLGTRYDLMKCALQELNASLKGLFALIKNPAEIKPYRGFRVVSGQDVEKARDRALLASDSFLFEFRSFLDLMAKFVYGVLAEIGKRPAANATLSSGSRIRLIDKRGDLKTHNFLLYLCDKLNVPRLWYDFLSLHRNFFMHEGAPYCVIEDLTTSQPKFDLIITKTNIHDFTSANPKDYFRVSEFQSVVAGIQQLASAAQNYLIQEIQK